MARISSKLQDTLAYPPRGMDVSHAAAYCGVSKTKFVELVDNGVLPPSKNLGGVPRWDRKALDAAWDALDDRQRQPTRRKSLDELLEAEDGESGSALRS